MTEIEKNKELCEKYPWLLPRNAFNDEIPADYDYSYTLLDEFEDGWKKAFGEPFCEDLQRALDELPKERQAEFRLIQIKEKYAQLVIYPNFHTEMIDKVINGYGELSKYICGKCGKLATKISLGWYYPFCDDCIDKSQPGHYMDIKEYYKELYKEENDDE